MYGEFGRPTMPLFLDEPEKENHRSRIASLCRVAQLDDETRGRFCWWRPSFRYRELEGEIKHKVDGTQEEDVDIPSATRESPSFEIPLLALIDIVAEGVEHTL